MTFLGNDAAEVSLHVDSANLNRSEANNANSVMPLRLFFIFYFIKLPVTWNNFSLVTFQVFKKYQITMMKYPRKNQESERAIHRHGRGM